MNDIRRIYMGLVVLLVLMVTVLAVPGGTEAQEKKTFTIALTGKFPPFSFYSEKGELIGFDVDVARGIAEKLDRELVTVTTEWDGILAGLLVGKYDAIIGSMAITAERAKKVNFSIPYYVSGAQLFVHKRSKESIKDISGLLDKQIGVGLGETYEHYLRNKYPDLDVRAYKGMVDIFQDMLNDRISGFVTDKYVGLYQVKASRMPFVAVGPLLYDEEMAIPVKLGNEELLAKINNALMSMRQDGIMTELHEKWFGAGAANVAGTSGGMSMKIVAAKLVKGFAITLFVAFVSLTLGFILAVPFGIILNKPGVFLYYVMRSINDFIRGTPLLIQLFFVYFGAPQVGVTLSPVQAAIFTLTINSATYMAEVIRSGLMSVDPGQQRAGRSLGLTKFEIFRFIIWPQAFRVALPSLMNVVIALVKDTALIAVISVAEVIREAQSIISVTYNPMKYYFIVAAMFFIFTFPLMKLAGKLEKSIRERGFSNA